MIHIIKNWQEVGIEPRGRNKLKARCPECSDRRTDKRDKSLHVSAHKGVAHCHYCGTNYVIEKPREPQTPTPMKTTYTKPRLANNTTLSTRAVKWFESRGITQATLGRMRIGEGPQYMPQHNGEANTVQFNYFDGGELINTKYRSGAKAFKFVSGAELIPYNVDAIKNTNIVYITEGEMDALSLIQLGYPAISVPNGASDNTAYLDRYMDPWLLNMPTVVIAVDTDTKGMLLREALTRRFGAEKCKLVSSWGTDCKDANECLMKHGSIALRAALDGAEYIPLEGVFSLSHFEPDLDALYTLGMLPGFTVGHTAFDRACSFNPGSVCVVTGIPGNGKSEFIDELMVRLNIRHGWKGAYFSPENLPMTYHTSKLVSRLTGKAFGADTLPQNEYEHCKRHVQNNFFFIQPEEDYTLEAIVQKARSLVRRNGIRTLVIDPWNRIEHRINAGITETNYVSRALDTLSTLAQREALLIFLVAHPAKMHKQPGEAEYAPPTLYDIAGSANFYNKADYGITVHRNRPLGVTEILVQKVRFKHLGTGGKTLFKYNSVNGRYAPVKGPEAEAVWETHNYVADMLPM